MARMRYSVGDKVDVSRAETGEDHERAVVIDSYELIIGEDRRPMVVVEFDDGERKYMTAATPNVLPVYEEEAEAESVGAQSVEAHGVEAESAERQRGGDEPAEPGDQAEDEVVYVEDEEGASP